MLILKSNKKTVISKLFTKDLIFRATELLLIGILFTLIGSLGWYVHQAEAKTNRLYTNIDNTNVQLALKKPAPTKPVPIAPPPTTPPPTSTPVQVVSVTPTTCLQNQSGKLLLISLSQQHLWACDATTTANESAITSGKTEIINGIDDQTPTGKWAIYSKQTNIHLRGSDANGSWDDPVDYWMPFDGSIGFHDASWQTFPYGSDQYKTDGSHGCIHLPTDMAAWVYSWAPIGTTVIVES